MACWTEAATSIKSGTVRENSSSSRTRLGLGFSPAAAMAGMAGYRDGIRDLTLQSKGFDVWSRAVATNWTVVGLFLVLFLAGLGVAGWLVSVMARSKKVMEGVA